MQRRAAAMYLALFVVLGAAAYGLIATTSAPVVSLDAQEYSPGNEIVLGDRTHTVDIQAESDGGEVTRTGELAWVNESATLTTTLDNGSEIPVTDVRWTDQQAREEAVLEDGSTVSYNGSEYAVSVNDTAGSFTLAQADDASVNETHAVGDTFTFRGPEATVTSVESGAATLVWGGPYLFEVQTENVTDPTEATFTEQRDIEALVQRDPALYNETIVQDGVQKVTYRANDTNVAVDEYFPPLERHTIAEGETLTYQGNETTVREITGEGVTVGRFGPAQLEADLSEGGNVTLANDEQYFAHFPSSNSVALVPSEQYPGYAETVAERDYFNERLAGLWGIVIVAGLAALLLVSMAYMPIRG